MFWSDWYVIIFVVFAKQLSNHVVLHFGEIRKMFKSST